MDQLRTLNIFLAVAEQNSFAAAGRILGVSPPVVTRAINTLESRLGVQLLIRTTRHVRLTEAGQQYLQDIKRILADMEQADAAVIGEQGSPKGQLIITAPAMFGRLYITPVISEFMQRYREVSVFAMMVDRITNLVEEGIDLGFRIGHLPDSSLRAVPLGSVKLKTYAAPSYLQKNGIPQRPDELLQHCLISSIAANPSSKWQFHEDGREVTLNTRPALTCTTNDSAVAAAKSGLGIVRVLSYQARPEVMSGNLEPILTSFDGPAIPVNLVYAQGRNIPAKIRLFIDTAVELLRREPVLNE